MISKLEIIAIINDLFIGLLYSRSTCQELMANMVSKIDHKELAEEAEMQSEIIAKLVE